MSEVSEGVDPHSSQGSQEVDLDRLAQRLETSKQEASESMEEVLNGVRLKRLVEKDGTLNIVNQRKLSSWAGLEYQKLMRFSAFSLIITFFMVFTLLLIVSASAIYVTNDGHKPVNTNDSATDIKNQELEYDCWIGVDGYYDSFLLSIEIVTTIGYGQRVVNSKCAWSICICMFINFIGTLLLCLACGVFLAWFINAHPGRIQISRVGVVTARNNEMFFMIRLADPITIGVDLLEVSGICIQIKKQKAGSKHSPILHCGDMSFRAFSNTPHNSVPLMWPTVVVHRIDHTSPLFTMSPEDLETVKLEIIVTVTGLRTETGTQIRCKTSYLCHEIIWGARFPHYYGETDLDMVVSEDFTPRQSALNMQLEERERAAITIQRWWRAIKNREN